MRVNHLGKITYYDSYEGMKVYGTSKGYPCICVDGKTVCLHVYIWERANGRPKPKGFVIHHKDKNVFNYDINNLELISPSDHKKLHEGWVRENGVWVAKPCNNCGRILPFDQFYTRIGIEPSALCKPCFLQKSSIRYYQKKAARIADRVSEVRT